MIDQSLVKSGYDLEFLMTAKYIRSLLLCSFDTGSITWWTPSEEKDEITGEILSVNATVLHPPKDLLTKRLYDVYPQFKGNEHPFQTVLPLVYSEQEDEFEVKILDDENSEADVQVRVYPSFIQNVDTETPQVLFSNVFNIDLQISFQLEKEFENGELSKVGIEIKLVDLKGGLIENIEALTQGKVKKADVMEDLQGTIDRTIDFPLTAGGSIQSIEMRKFVDQENKPNAFGFYLNLLLQDGPNPESILAERGNHFLAENFLAADSEMGFAFSSQTYAYLGRDMKFKMAQLVEGSSDQYHYPLIDNGATVGKIKGITVKPELSFTNGEAVFTNKLILEIHGEYYFDVIDLDIDPDFYLKIKLSPEYKNGVLEFEIDYDLDLSPLVTILGAFFLSILSIVLPKVGIPLFVIAVLATKMGEKWAISQAREALESEMNRTSFLDSLPNKLPIEKRRWDPLFFTNHRLCASRADCEINGDGFALDVKEIKLGKTAEPIDQMVIRSEIRDEENKVSGLYYRSNDLGNYLETDLVLNFASTYRLPYENILDPEPDIESYRIGLTIEQIEERLTLKEVHKSDLEYIPKKVDINDHQIYKILSISKMEIPEIERITRQYLRNEIRDSQSTQIRERAVTELEAELGRTPTEQEITDRFNSILNEMIASGFPSRNLIEQNRRLKFQLEPSEFAQLQRKNILVLGKDHLIIVDKRSEDRVVTYYRDYEVPFEPNVNKNDNLMNLPKYKSTDI